MAEELCWLHRMKHLPLWTSINISCSSIKPFSMATVFPNKEPLDERKGRKEMKRQTGWYNQLSHHYHYINDLYIMYKKEEFSPFLLQLIFFSCHILTLGRSDRSRFCNLPFWALGQVTLGFNFFICKTRIFKDDGEGEETKERQVLTWKKFSLSHT